MPFPSILYLTLYVATLVIHVLFMGYVLAGSAYLATVVVLQKPGERGPLEPFLREWLPFMLSLAITAGIAPLLFLQILYRPQFYTANLLLFHRWMAVVPVLIVGFYLLYLLKNRWSEARSRAVSIPVAVVAAGCFVFIAWSWTENHLLSLAGQTEWTEQYASGSLVYRSAQTLPRLAMWICGTFPILAVWLSWQMWWRQRSGDAQAATGSPQAAAVGLSGLVLASLCAGLYGITMPREHRDALSSFTMLVSWMLVATGNLGMTVFFVKQLRRQRLGLTQLSVQSTALLMAVSGAACLRESIRLQSIDVASLVANHEAAAAVGGRWAFVGFLLVNAALIGWCLRIASRQRSRTGSTARGDQL